jgi:hypothetical protein
MLRAIRSAVALVALVACSASSSGGGAPAAQPCAPEDTVASDGTCIGPGVPPGGCDPGFTYDGNGGCEPILPPTDCGEGEMAVPGDRQCYAVGAAGDPPSCPSGQVALPGETACHELADCGSAPWGNIPVDTTTQYVDASYTGGASDGSAGAPWTTIGDAVTAAMPDAVIAVAAGSYAESVSVTGKAVRLWGRCPGMVEIVGGTDAAAVTLGTTSDGTEIHAIALTGAGAGASLGSAHTVIVDSVWVHDTASFGVYCAGSATVRGSLVERAATTALALSGGDVSIDASVVRDTAPAADGYGYAIAANDGSLVVTASVFERNIEVQLALFGADATFDGCVVRDALPKTTDMSGGFGIFAEPDAGRPAKVTVLASTFERNRATAIEMTGSDAFIGGTLIRDTQSQTSDLGAGAAISAQPVPPSGPTSNVTATRSLLERNRYFGASALGANLSLDRCVVRDTLPRDSDGTGGEGVSAEYDGTTGLRSSLAVTGSLVERSRTVGLSVIGSSGTVAGTVLRDTSPEQSDSSLGYGLQVAADPSTKKSGALTITGSVVTGNRDAGISSFGGAVVMDRTVVSGTQTSPQGAGMGVLSGVPTNNQSTGRGTLAVTRSLIAADIMVGLYLAHTDATVSQTWIRGVVATPSGSVYGGAYGDGVSVQSDAVLTASSCRIEGGARAGVSMFDTAQITLSNATLDCDAISLDSEDQSSFDNGGGLVCSCAGSTTPCQVLSSSLQPPPAVAPIATSSNP